MKEVGSPLNFNSGRDILRDWGSFVELLQRLEEANRYVGLTRLLDEWMAGEPERYGESRSDRRSYLRAAEKEGVVGLYQLPANLAGGRSRQVSAVKLNRDHPVVATSLGRSRDAGDLEGVASSQKLEDPTL